MNPLLPLLSLVLLLTKNTIYIIFYKISRRKEGGGARVNIKTFFNKIIFQHLDFFLKSTFLGGLTPKFIFENSKSFPPGDYELTHPAPPGSKSTKTLHFRMAAPGDTGNVASSLPGDAFTKIHSESYPTGLCTASLRLLHPHSPLSFLGD